MDSLELHVKAPAKINLTLDVLFKREDDYHELEMVMTTIDLADRIRLKMLDDDVIRINALNRYVPSDERNLAYQAAHQLKTLFSIKKGVEITIEKNIPVAAGLAGGSSDAAACLRGLNKLWGLNLKTEELAEIGARIGSDVPFCVYGGTALAKGRGEVLTRLPAPPSCWVVLAKPSIGVSTSFVYHQLDLREIRHPDTKTMIDAIYRQDFRGICENLGNVLESVTLKYYPEVKQIKEDMKRFGADGVLMSGSGPTVYALVRHESRMHRIYNGLKGFCKQVYAVRMLGQPLEE
ncbi:4-diphosphocytidyl-2-C-methyl-D-erythritol kinase [Caldibacillus debilis]|uniref:4-diphosphocytidyl-2-C-methyl-D-erythritol kinase n=1 Tax=Caldibacillus debilis TaxID=301148 RepID=A0A150M2H4_9BACI|nr:4-diphosphocytidyl-2-C-methyl-D-erythritol kinase [Caldibacillus debilis]